MADEDGDEDLLPARRPLSAGVLHHWSVVRCGCIEGVLATAILAGQHADVWDAASLLLREHCRCLQQSAPLRPLCAFRFVVRCSAGSPGAVA